MAPPNNPAVCKVSLVGNRDTREWVNTYHVSKNTGSMVAADLANIAVAFYNWWHNDYKSIVPTNIVLDVIQVRKLDPSDPLALDYTTNLPEGGTDGATAEPANVSLAISWRTGFAGRKYRGRFFDAGIPTGVVTAIDTVNSTYVTQWVVVAAHLLADVLSAGPYALSIFHKFDNSFTVIQNFVIDAILDSMRRRLPGRGR